MPFFWHSVFADGLSTPAVATTAKRLVVNTYSLVTPLPAQRLFFRRLERDALSLLPGAAASKNAGPISSQSQRPATSGIRWGLTHSAALNLQLQRTDTMDVRNEYNEISISATPVKSTVTVLSMGLKFSF